MQDINDLKNIIIQSLETKGALSQIRAQIRSSVFKAIEEDDKNINKSENFEWENQKSLEITNNEELVWIGQIFHEFLSFFKLEYTSNIFYHEINFKNPPNKDFLLKKLNLKNYDSSKPILYNILEEAMLSKVNINPIITPNIDNNKNPENRLPKKKELQNQNLNLKDRFEEFQDKKDEIEDKHNEEAQINENSNDLEDDILNKDFTAKEFSCDSDYINKFQIVQSVMNDDEFDDNSEYGD